MHNQCLSPLEHPCPGCWSHARCGPALAAFLPHGWWVPMGVTFPSCRMRETGPTPPFPHLQHNLVWPFQFSSCQTLYKLLLHIAAINHQSLLEGLRCASLQTITSLSSSHNLVTASYLPAWSTYQPINPSKFARWVHCCRFPRLRLMCSLPNIFCSDAYSKHTLPQLSPDELASFLFPSHYYLLFSPWDVSCSASLFSYSILEIMKCSARSFHLQAWAEQPEFHICTLEPSHSALPRYIYAANI